MLDSFLQFSFNGSGRAEIGMILPDFEEEELDIEVTDGQIEVTTQLYFDVKQL